MRKGIHPTYYTDAQVICSCGNTWTTGSTRQLIRTDVCSKCHPFFTDQEARASARTSLDRPISELELGTRATEALAKAEIVNVGQALEKLSQGEAAILAIDGFGRKSLADLKKRLRQFGYELPEAAEEIVV
jgi:large subunit ribosomal protein L31